MESDVLILPNNPLYAMTLDGSLPPSWERKASDLGHFPNFVADSQTGLLRPASRQELDEYLHGGEYYERLDNMDEYEIEVVEL